MATKSSNINLAFIDIISRDTLTSRKINEAILNGMTPEEAIKKYDKRINRDATYYYIIAALAVIASGVLTSQQKLTYAPIIGFTSMYSTQAPNLFANKVDKIFNGNNLSTREKAAKGLLQQFIDKGKETIRKIENKIIDNRIKSKSEIYKDVKATKGETFKEKKKELKSKYTDPKRLERALKTEIHAELEQAKLEQSKSLGFEYKIWKTRNDSRVRDTEWHDAVKDKRVPIDKPFRAKGMHAMYPGDITLPIGERIRCRCYLVYE